ncbi:preprotein translocase subunit SecE [Adlercreutzia faecimuris]|uniref:Preprotein translocase subunit SecE n=1 Tax=Adlercreutzia faecimuris TaxID=2897341 RepID=A0ABS9WIA5_9ACTN|nr:preprotein translocase subunit SecE [Adlercreutzia sp. JBNU-10]MCI2242002.1 preprotein translocase subunit SecE [Adlercreutzia sp. JBNU-10]
MGNSPRYLRWLAALCATMGVFGVLVLAIGYQDLSIGRGATIALLLAAAVVLYVLARRLDYPKRK